MVVSSAIILGRSMIENLSFLAYRPNMQFEMDVLSQMLEMLKLRGSVYCRSSLAKPWQLYFENHDCMVFHAVEHGQALLEMGQETLLLKTGDFVLLPRGTAHRVSHPNQSLGARVPQIQMLESDPYRNEIWTLETPETILLCGTFYLTQHLGHLLVPALPKILHIPRQPWLDATLHPMTLEATQNRLGATTVLKRFADVLFVQIMRYYLETQPFQRQGWLAGLQDSQIARALTAIHAQPAHAWTVASLAKCALLSRSGFAAKFKSLMAQAPLEYLTHWRMTLATIWLQEPRANVLEVANRVGYQSEVAFHRAYKRITGRTPGMVKQQNQRISSAAR
jgi:AraC-like DNA-binding protein